MLIDYLTSFFERQKFTKNRKNTWSKKVNDALFICQLQKSRYSEDAFLNIGLIFPELSEIDREVTSINSWHAEGRFEAITENKEFSGLFPMNLNEQHSDLIEMFERAFMTKVVPFIEEYSELNTLSKSIEAGDFDYGKMVVALDQS